MMSKKMGVEVVAEAKKVIKTEIGKGRDKVQREIGKVKKQLEGTYHKVETYVKKNPEKAALITAAIGAAVGAALTKFLSSSPKGKKK